MSSVVRTSAFHVVFVPFEENGIPLAVFLREKHNGTGLVDRQSNSAASNPTYQAYFEALLTETPNQQRHESDRTAVIKYIRRRERRKRADENRKSYQLTDDALEKVCEQYSIRIVLFVKCVCVLLA
jgi:hypothetical protein